MRWHDGAVDLGNGDWGDHRGGCGGADPNPDSWTFLKFCGAPSPVENIMPSLFWAFASPASACLRRLEKEEQANRAIIVAARRNTRKGLPRILDINRFIIASSRELEVGDVDRRVLPPFDCVSASDCLRNTGNFIDKWYLEIFPCTQTVHSTECREGYTFGLLRCNTPRMQKFPPFPSYIRSPDRCLNLL